MIVLHLHGASSIDSRRSNRASLDVCKTSSLPREVDSCARWAYSVESLVEVAEKQVVLNTPSNEIRMS
jgi:hypothetical protein